VADGAFPDSERILVSATQPGRIYVSTNFGLLRSDDAAASFSLVCEEAIAPLATLYQLGASPAEVLLAVGTNGLVRSTDHGCSWSVAATAGLRIQDAFPDPLESRRVLAIGRLSTDGGAERSVLVESEDGGAGFGAPLYVAPAGALLSGVESARGAPDRVYLTEFALDPAMPSQVRAFLVRRSSAQAPFVSTELTSALGGRSLRLLGVDPVRPEVVYLRVLGANGDALAVSEDGGATAEVRLELGARMSAFLRHSDGRLFVGSAAGKLLVSTDGRTFAQVGGALRPRALAEWEGALLVAADDLVDGFALGVSRDGGQTLTRLLKFAELCGTLACGDLPLRCAGPLAALRSLVGSSPAPACSGEPGPASRQDAATGPTDLSSGPAAATGGCGCDVPHPPPGSHAAPALALGGLALLLFSLKRRHQRRKS
jgi:photosystem II stability/assembly factor-like uncharacterized protein